MQNGREGPRRAVIVNDVRDCVGLGHLGRWCHTHIEVIGLILIQAKSAAVVLALSQEPELA